MTTPVLLLLLQHLVPDSNIIKHQIYLNIVLIMLYQLPALHRKQLLYILAEIRLELLVVILVRLLQNLLVALLEFWKVVLLLEVSIIH